MASRPLRDLAPIGPLAPPSHTTRPIGASFVTCSSALIGDQGGARPIGRAGRISRSAVHATRRTGHRDERGPLG